MENREQSANAGANMSLLHGGRLVLEDGVIEDGAVLICGRSIAYAGPSDSVPQAVRPPGARQPLTSGDARRYDVSGRWIFPGFIDVHVHGGGGADTMHASVEALATMARLHGTHGTTGFLATTMSAAHEPTVRAVRAVQEAMERQGADDWRGARLLGLHLEGPYLNPKRAGAQDPVFMRPANLGELQEILGVLGENFRLVTLAPEIEGGMEALSMLRAHGVVVSLGHTDATFEEAEAAFAAGATHVTHTFNGMRGLHHRDPGIAGAALLRHGARCEVIADGIHLHPEAIRLIVRLKGRDDVCLITDAIEAAGVGEGTYRLGSYDVFVKDGACRLANGSLAGSILTMDRAVGYMVQEVGVPVADVARMAALNQARELGMADRKGSLVVGKDADIAVLDEGFRAVQTWVEGRLIHSAL